MKKIFIILISIFTVFLITACGGNDNEAKDEPNNTLIEYGVTNSLKEDAGIKFDRLNDFVYTRVDTNDEDFEVLKSKYASQVPYVKYETTFSLTSVEMDMTGNYSAIFVYNNGEWSFSFGYITDKSTWEYTEKEASRVDKQHMLNDLKQQSFGTFEKGYVGNAKYSSIGSIINREYDKTIHRDVIKTTVNVKTDFAEYKIPIILTYYFQQGEWQLGGTEISEVDEWELTYNNGSAPEFLSDSVLLSYLTTSSNFLTYVCNLDYVSDYKITKESEIASKEEVIVNYIFSATYQYIGTIEYNVELKYEWLNNEWSEPQPTPSVRNADFSEMLTRTWESDDGSYFKFASIEPNDDMTFKLSGQYSTNSSVDIVANLNVPLRDNNWDANITDINGNQIWDIPSSTFELNLQYGAIVYNNTYFAPIEINIIEEEPEEEKNNTSNVLMYEQIPTQYDNQIIRENILVSDISVYYENKAFVMTANITNKSEGQSGYTVSIALFDENDYIVGEGSISNGDSMLLPSSAAAGKITIENMEEEEHAKIKKIIVYIKAQ